MIGRLKRWLIRSVLLGTIKDIAEGKHGPRLKAVYWWLEGKKTVAGLILAAGCYVAHEAQIRGMCVDCSDVCGYIAAASVVLVQAGLLDEALRHEAPKR